MVQQMVRIGFFIAVIVTIATGLSSDEESKDPNAASHVESAAPTHCDDDSCVIVTLPNSTFRGKISLRKTAERFGYFKALLEWRSQTENPPSSVELPITQKNFDLIFKPLHGSIKLEEMLEEQGSNYDYVPSLLADLDALLALDEMTEIVIRHLATNHVLKTNPWMLKALCDLDLPLVNHYARLYLQVDLCFVLLRLLYSDSTAETTTILQSGWVIFDTLIFVLFRLVQPTTSDEDDTRVLEIVKPFFKSVSESIIVGDMLVRAVTYSRPKTFNAILESGWVNDRHMVSAAWAIPTLGAYNKADAEIVKILGPRLSLEAINECGPLILSRALRLKRLEVVMAILSAKWALFDGEKMSELLDKIALYQDEDEKDAALLNALIGSFNFADVDYDLYLDALRRAFLYPCPLTVAALLKMEGKQECQEENTYLAHMKKQYNRKPLQFLSRLLNLLLPRK